ncbi:phosphatase PAP2 family protein [Chromobacterium aquaticum]|uniref:Phosphatase PAP2 family protein n=1 Tax=Chromobacterium aquaticum TaxID=467180 RepID=A0ABV8ZUN0_9NEIS|nr:phosphatase PAP2 family protein [Chromobacterium aquaticum]MCD5363142.1 phosphatase PAP2 family protein [Chromobacterium aquaticum]
MWFKLSCLRRLWPALLLSPLAFLLAISPDCNRELFLILHEAGRVAPGAFWRLLSVLGDWPTVLALLLALSWRRPDKLPALLAGCGMGVFLAIVLKAGFAEPRPPLVLPPGSVQLLDDLPGNGSFPSGHAMASATLASFLYYSGMLRRGVVLTTVVILVMLSRLAIGVHWPLDVAVGALLGWAAMYAACVWAWPRGWPEELSARVQMALLAPLAGQLLWLLYKSGSHEEYALRLALCALVLAAGCWRWRRLRQV